MRAYYLSPAQFALSNLALKRLKVARFSELNDPFELLAVDVANLDLRVGISAKKDQINKDEGLVCFSRAWRDPLLWSHYGDAHRGVCLGFDLPDSLIEPVQYVKGLHKIDVAAARTAQETVDRILLRLRFTKFDGWAYENEVRLFVALKGLQAQSGLYFVPFSETLTLREVILGARCDLPIESLRHLVQSFFPPVKVMRSRIAYTKFAVVEDRSSRASKNRLD